MSQPSSELSAAELYEIATEALLERGQDLDDGYYLFIRDAEPDRYGHIKLTDFTSVNHVDYSPNLEVEDPVDAKKRILEARSPILIVTAKTVLDGMSQSVWLFKPSVMDSRKGSLGEMILGHVPDTHSPSEPILIGDNGPTNSTEHPYLNLLLQDASSDIPYR